MSSGMYIGIYVSLFAPPDAAILVLVADHFLCERLIKIIGDEGNATRVHDVINDRVLSVEHPETGTCDSGQ